MESNFSLVLNLECVKGATLLLNNKFSLFVRPRTLSHLSAPRAPLESRPNHLRNMAHFCLSGEQKTRHYSSGSCNSQRRIFRPLCFCFHADNHKLLSRIVVVVVSFLLIYCKCRAAAAARREEGNVVQAERRGRKSLS